jgi:uncharacterized protein
MQTVRRASTSSALRFLIDRTISHLQQFVFAIALVALLLLAACGKASEQSPIISKHDGQPALWKVTGAKGKGGAAYLFGTVHSLPADMHWQSSKLDDAMFASDSLVIEVIGLEDSTTITKLFNAMGTSAGLPPIDHRVETALRAKLIEAAEPVPGPVSALDNLESWAAALQIGAYGNTGLGLSQALGVESVLQRRFYAEDKPISALETASQQFGFFDTLPESEQRLMLAEVARSAKDARKDYQELLDDWMQGRVDTLVESADKGLLASPKLRAVLLDGRNRNWAEQIAAMIDKGGHPFVAVGAGHLGGPTGVPALLLAEGYTVERVQ